MELIVKQSFYRDLSKHSNRHLLGKVNTSIKQVIEAKSINEIQGIIKLKKYKTFYRVRIGEYRLGLVIKGKKVWLVRFGHRSHFYKDFP